jgi:hypothetical protein
VEAFQNKYVAIWEIGGHKIRESAQLPVMGKMHFVHWALLGHKTSMGNFIQHTPVSGSALSRTY